MKKKNLLNELSNEDRRIGKCRSCMTLRRRNKELGKNMMDFKNLYCMDCFEGLKPVKDNTKPCKQFFRKGKNGNDIFCGTLTANHSGICHNCRSLYEEEETEGVVIEDRDILTVIQREYEAIND